jgi:tol-pal system protein YbgF
MGHCTMTFFGRTLLSLAASPVCLAIVSIAPEAEGARTAYSRVDQLATQTAETPNATMIAQAYQRPPGEVEGGEPLYPGEQADGGSAGLLVRLGRLESQMRQINGQIEQMQFETRRLEEQLKKFQEDVEFRFRDRAQPAPAGNPSHRRGETSQPQINGGNRIEPQAQNAAAVAQRANGRGDAFEPSQAPDAPGAPRSLGSFAANRADQGFNGGGQPGSESADPGAPLDLTNGRSQTFEAAPATAGPMPAPVGIEPHGPPSSQGTVIAGVPKSPKGEFDLAMAYLKQGAYENAEKGFSGFLEKNPKDKLASDAVYYLGESYYLRGRRREAAEQFLKVSTLYASSPRAPQALLRLGQSLSALGAKEQACATFGEITRKYPNAPAMVKTEAEREAKRSQC